MKLNGGRVVTGVLRGFDPYMNIVLDDAMEERTSSEKYNIGMVVSISLCGIVVHSRWICWIQHPLVVCLIIDCYIVILIRLLHLVLCM